MREEILQEAIRGLRREGLRFSVDTIAETLHISKKTIYKYFSDKQELADALYDAYFEGVRRELSGLVQKDDLTKEERTRLLTLYYDVKVMTREEIYNKYKLNDLFREHLTDEVSGIWRLFTEALPADADPETDRILIDGAFEKACWEHRTEDEVSRLIERMVGLLW